MLKVWIEYQMKCIRTFVIKHQLVFLTMCEFQSFFPLCTLKCLQRTSFTSKQIRISKFSLWPSISNWDKLIRPQKPNFKTMNLEDSSPARACSQRRRTTRAMKNTRDKRKSSVNVVHLLSLLAHNNLSIMRVVSWLPNYQYTGTSTWGGKRTGQRDVRRNFQVM